MEAAKASRSIAARMYLVPVLCAIGAGVWAFTAPARGDTPEQHGTAANTALALDAAADSEPTPASPVNGQATAEDFAESSSPAMPPATTALIKTEQPPAAAATPAPARSVPIPRRNAPVGATSPAAAAVGTPSTPLSKFASGFAQRDVPWYRNVWVALAAVLILIFSAAKLMRRFVAGGQRTAATGAKVLGRTPLGAKQAVVLLHVGQRVILVGQTGEQLRTLAEFREPGEVALLLGKTVSTPQPREQSFARRLNDEFEAYDESPAPEATLGSPAETDEALQRASGQLDSLVNRLRALQVEA